MGDHATLLQKQSICGMQTALERSRVFSGTGGIIFGIEALQPF
jgi:hypothetical protein